MLFTDLLPKSVFDITSNSCDLSFNGDKENLLCYTTAVPAH